MVVSKTVASSAYLSGKTAKRVMMVKPLSIEAFNAQYGYIGRFSQLSEDSHLGTFRLNHVPSQNQAIALIENMVSDLNLEYSYFAPVAYNAVEKKPGLIKRNRTKKALAETPNFESKQFYLEASPKGVGARDAWTLKGGTGENVRVVDVEVCWEQNHEDFKTPFYVGANPKCDDTNHGTAVWGEVAAKRDGKGVTGIAHGTDFGIYGFIEGDLDDVNDQYISGMNTAVQGAMKNLSAGDVLIIEQHMVGPDHGKYVAVEYWPHIYEQLKKATEAGIICVEAAGNGNSNFDGDIYAGAFDLEKRDSGCILVGAGDHNTLNRLSFSNYGSRVDAFAFGSDVTTTAYGDLFNGGSSTRKYTSNFSGTSSATPIVSGAVAVVSSLAKQAGKVITPAQMRDALRSSGTFQGTRTQNERIGNLPNIAELIQILGIHVEAL